MVFYTRFDKIGHQWRIDNILIDKSMLRQWLSSGYIDKGLFYHTDTGTPQSCIISPTLMLLTLWPDWSSALNRRADKVNFISYADDFVVTGTSYAR
ncbi:hypothetical protein [Photorhabdus stackebrandtii]|uniref:hypothetical protein n=1 Tax=Photorhabdus stackebrandtii TaxID=1123042 RepID=UPI001A9A05D7|nr:hypothetical protein [Photorhabdus stackebrandtii]